MYIMQYEEGYYCERVPEYTMVCVYYSSICFKQYVGYPCRVQNP